jgi:hypothetical protein
VKRARAPIVAALLASALFSPACGSDSSPAEPSVMPSATPGGPAVQRGTPIGQDGPADLTISYVERLPRIDYVVNSGDPATEGWPAPGSSVTWRAHVKNWSGRALDGVDYTWTLDGATAATGTLSVGSGSEATAAFPWTWERRRRELRFTIDGGNRHTVRGGNRNSVRVHTDALAIGLYVERDFYDYFRRFQHELRIGNSSFEDWAHLQVDFFNQILAGAVSADTPQGVLDRVRLDAVHVVPNGALPLDPAAFSIGGSFDAAQARPDIRDRRVDMQWGFPSRLLELGVYADHASLETNNQFFYSGYIQHEMGHARYLVDVYAWDVYDRTAGSLVELVEGGERVAGSRYLPGRSAIFNGVAGLHLHRTPHQGLMTSEWAAVDRYSAVALNLIAGHRALDGNYNEPANLGSFLNDLPRENRLVLRDSPGQALAQARVQIFQARPGDAGVAAYSKVFDATPDLQLQADAQGRVLLGTNPFSRAGRIAFTDAVANGTAIMRVEHGGRVGYGFLESSDFNLQYWRGRTELGEYELRVPLF